jgi:AraC-like DNA-binding protein
MGEQLYNYSLFAAMVLLFFFGGSLLFSKVPCVISVGYGRARKILGVAFYAFSIQMFIQWKFEFRVWNPMVAAALNFTCFYLEAFLFGMSFISLLDNSYINKRRLMRDLCKYVVFLLAMWISVLLLDGLWTKLMMAASSLFFCVEACRISALFFRTYRNVVKKVDNYYSDDVMAFVKWLYKSTYGIVLFGLSCSVMAFAPRWAVGIYMFLGIFMFVYIYNSFQNYMMYYGEVKTATDVVLPTEADARPAIADEIEERINRWVAERKYCNAGITIENLAMEIGTNRAYLSAFINREAKHTFREWITMLRLENAKHLLTERQDMTVSDVATKCGFSSDSYFVRLFSASEGTTPAKWRANTFKTK